MQKYDPSWSPNEGDSALRYAFKNQPDVSAWNCERLAEAFSSVIGEGARNVRLYLSIMFAALSIGRRDCVLV